jgi:hypothetical protein
VWATTIDANRQPTYDPISQREMPSFDQQLAGNVPDVVAKSDDAWFLKVYQRMRAGQSYYPAFHDALVQNPRWKPASALDYRLPTLFWAWSLLPDARGVVFAFLLLAGLGVVCVVPITAASGRAPLAIPACAAVAAYFVYFPVQMPLFSQEAWAVALGLCAFAATALSMRGERWRAWLVAAVVAACLGTLVRETLVFVPLAGLVSAALPSEQRRVRLSAWGVGVAAIAAAYFAHYLATKPLTQWAPGPGRFNGGVANVIGAIEYATDMLGGGGALPYLLVALGIVGIALLPDARLRLFALLGAVLLLLSFLVLGNRAWYETSGAAINYWGATVIPLVYAFIPAAFSVVPGAAVRGAVRERLTRPASAA